MKMRIQNLGTQYARQWIILAALSLFSFGCQVHVAFAPHHKPFKISGNSKTDRQPGRTLATNADPASPENLTQAHTAKLLPAVDDKRSAKAEQSSSGIQQPEITLTQLQDSPSGNAVLLMPDESSPIQPSLLTGNSMLPHPAEPTESEYQIQLTTALQLAGASNLQIQLAAERVREAYARFDGAKVLWVPSINAGIGYTKHDGRLQETEGEVLEVSRNSLFVGGGAVLSGAPLTGGSGGPARLFVDISPVDIYFEPLATRQAAEASQAKEVSTFNDTLLNVVLAYLELERGKWQVAIANEAVDNSVQLAELTKNFAENGVGLEADAVRANAELANHRRQMFESEERVQVVSAELARMLRLDPKVTLFAIGSEPVPVAVVSNDLSLDDLIEKALSTRPELSHDQAVVAETIHRLRQEKLRPWFPNIVLGASGGGFGGGEGSFLGNFGGRSDFDALAVWELRNLGLGNKAILRERESRYRQANLSHQQTAERIAAEVARAFQRTQFLMRQVEQSQLQVGFAQKALPLNLEGIRGGVLRPIEAQQAITGLAAARRNYLQAIIDYNQAQFQLLRAVGQTPDSMPTDLMPTDTNPPLVPIPSNE